MRPPRVVNARVRLAVTLVMAASLSGAYFRMVADAGNWDESVAINTPGQSGDPASPHCRDLAPIWADGRYFPLAYSPASVEKVTVRRIRLTPPPEAKRAGCAPSVQRHTAEDRSADDDVHRRGAVPPNGVVLNHVEARHEIG